MKQLLISYAEYEYWANERLLQVILTLSDEQQQKEISSSFASIYKTCLHVWDASTIWWKRLQKDESIKIPSLTSTPTMQEVADGLLMQNRKWIEWIKSSNDDDLEKILDYKTMKGDPFSNSVKEIVLHLNNHGTYHRGQLVTMLRQVGVEKGVATDYILFVRG